MPDVSATRRVCRPFANAGAPLSFVARVANRVKYLRDLPSHLRIVLIRVHDKIGSRALNFDRSLPSFTAFKLEIAPTAVSSSSSPSLLGRVYKNEVIDISVPTDLYEKRRVQDDKFTPIYAFVFQPNAILLENSRMKNPVQKSQFAASAFGGREHDLRNRNSIDDVLGIDGVWTAFLQKGEGVGIVVKSASLLVGVETRRALRDKFRRCETFARADSANDAENDRRSARLTRRKKVHFKASFLKKRIRVWY